MYRGITLIIACVCMPYGLLAQSFKGNITDEKQHPVEYATVALHTLPDSAIVQTTLADSVGQYLFGPLKEGTYFMEASATGFKHYNSKPLLLAGNTVGFDIVLTKQGKDLGEVEVTATKALIIQKPDRTIVNVDALLSGAGGTALDILSKSPGVQVDANGNISLKGKQGVNVYIDDRPMYLSGEELANYLRSLPSSSLDQVELMTNPPARYDAAGNAGIINIKTKRNKVKGLNGSLSLAIGQGKLTRSNDNAIINYRNNKVNVFLNLNYNLNNNFTDLYLYRTYKRPDDTPLSYLDQDSYFKRNGNAYSATAGVDYYVSEKSTLGMVLTGMYRKSSSLNDNTSRLSNSAHVLDSLIIASNNNDSRFTNNSLNLNYRSKLGKNNQELTADADYIIYRNRTEQTYGSRNYLPDNTFKSQDVLLGHLPSNIDIYSLKGDYVNPFAKQWKLESGLKYSNIKTDNTADYKTKVGGITMQDYDKSNRFIYTEQISAGYINLSRETAGLSLQAGLRLEHTLSDGHQLGNLLKPDSAFRRNYTNLFPTFYASYKFDSLAKHQAGINYGRRIDRPYYEDLNPFLYPMDKFTYYTGNPFLKPSITHNVELSYTYNSRITAAVNYSKSRDNVNETIEIKDGIYYSRSTNIGSKTTATFSINASLQPFKWLTVNTYDEIGTIKTTGAFLGGQISTSGDYWFVSCNARASLGKGWDAELSGNYRSRIFDAQFIMEQVSLVNLALQKKFGSKYTLRISGQDMFYGQVIKGTITNLTLAEAGWINKRDSRQVVVGFTWTFGKKAGDKQKYTPTGADELKNRVKG